jgi:uncharacterized Tic20 family protein
MPDEPADARPDAPTGDDGADAPAPGVPVDPRAQDPGGGAAPPGWYPDPTGAVRWWDGTRWSDHVAPAPGAGPVSSPSDDRTWAILAHVGQILFGFIPPLVIYLVKRDDSPFVRMHSAEALNFSITLLIAYLVSAVLVLAVIGIFLLLAVWICSIVFTVQAAVAANRLEPYRYPVNLRLVS